MQNNPENSYSLSEPPEGYEQFSNMTPAQVEEEYQRWQVTEAEREAQAAYFSAREFSQEFGITSRRIRVLAAQGRIPGAFQHATRGWLIPRAFKLERGKRGPKVTF